MVVKIVTTKRDTMSSGNQILIWSGVAVVVLGVMYFMI